MDAFEMGLKFSNWLCGHFGRFGCGVFLLLYIFCIVVVFIMLNKLPESKKVIVWSKCISCKYKRKNYNAVVLTCPLYEEPSWITRKSSLCSCEEYDGCKVLYQTGPVFNRADLPEDYE